MEQKYSIDLAPAKDRKTLHTLIAQTLHFPAYYGCNLDALYDILFELPQKTTVHFTNCAVAKDALGSYLDAFFDTFADAATDGAPICIE